MNESQTSFSSSHAANATSGNWNAAPYCDLIPFYCPALSAPSNGSLNTSSTSYTYGTSVRFSCNPGWNISGGNALQSCELFNATKGMWSSSAVSCSIILNYCGLLNVGQFVTASGTTNHTVLSVASIGCQNGYVLSGASSATCQQSASWTAPGTCSAKNFYCTAVSAPQFGSVSYANSQIIGSNLTYR
jgi:hypothetical protein